MRGSMFFFSGVGVHLKFTPRSLQKGGGGDEYMSIYTSYKLIIFTSHQSYFLYRYIFFEKY